MRKQNAFTPILAIASMASICVATVANGHAGGKRPGATEQITCDEAQSQLSSSGSLTLQRPALFGGVYHAHYFQTRDQAAASTECLGFYEVRSARIALIDDDWCDVGYECAPVPRNPHED